MLGIGDDNKKKGKGRGWHGDSRGHAEAGRKGGRARGRNAKKKAAMAA